MNQLLRMYLKIMIKYEFIDIYNLIKFEPDWSIYITRVNRNGKKFFSRLVTPSLRVV